MAMLLFNRRDYKDLTAGNSMLNLPYRRQGLAGRLTYDYAGRYLAEFNFGYNGSENFRKGSRYGFFPSASLGWVVSGEEFWQRSGFLKDIYFKLRGSYGVVGNEALRSSAEGRAYGVEAMARWQIPGRVIVVGSVTSIKAMRAIKPCT